MVEELNRTFSEVCTEVSTAAQAVGVMALVGAGVSLAICGIDLLLRMPFQGRGTTDERGLVPLDRNLEVVEEVGFGREIFEGLYNYVPWYNMFVSMAIGVSVWYIFRRFTISWNRWK